VISFFSLYTNGEDMVKQFKELSDAQWAKIESLMAWIPPLERGEKRAPLRKVWNSIFYILIYGCRWRDLPKEPSYAARSTSHRWMMKFEKAGVFQRVLCGLLLEAKKTGKVDFRHLLVDGTFSLSTRGRPRSSSWL